MENNPMNVERWVDDRLRVLDSGNEPQPSAARVLARLHSREQSRRGMRRNLIRAGIVTSVACVGLAAMVTIRYFNPDAQPVARVSEAKTVAAPASATPDAIAFGPVTGPVSKPPRPPAPALAPLRNFKETGSPTATVACEVYTDYECPPCAAFYHDTIPLLVSQYVDTGKVRLLRRDYPLPMHPHAILAARYANAAGLIGQYETVTDQIFRTQSTWRQDGDIDSQVADVLSPDSMQKLRDRMKDTHALDEMIDRDRALGADEHIDQTPTIVIVANGKRQKVTNVTSFGVLKDYLDELLAQQQ
jgi:protein-disulfide isomerase